MPLASGRAKLLLYCAPIMRVRAPYHHHPARFVLIIYDCKQACEAKTAPHQCTPPLQLARMNRAIGATIDARAKAAGLERTALVPGDMYVLFDGGKVGNDSKMRAAFRNPDGSVLAPISSQTLHLRHWDSVLNANGRGYTKRGAGSLRHGEQCLFVAHSLPMTSRTKNINNYGHAMVMLDSFVECMWKLPLARKRDLLGKYRVDGRPTFSEAEDDDDQAEYPWVRKAPMDDSTHLTLHVTGWAVP